MDVDDARSWARRGAAMRTPPRPCSPRAEITGPRPRPPPAGAPAIAWRAMARLGRTDLDVFPLCLGGNVFGWTADEAESFAVLDAYVEAGGNFIDTANSYLVEHGRSEQIIGRWMAERGNRDELVIATKVG